MYIFTEVTSFVWTSSLERNFKEHSKRRAYGCLAYTLKFDDGCENPLLGNYSGPSKF
jgi:hypothetical protein